MGGIDLFSQYGSAPTVAPRQRNAVGVASAVDGPLARVPALPCGLHLGTSSWSFPGWKGIVYANAHAEAALSRQGLAAYAGHRLLKTVSIDRTFYSAIDAAAYRHYAMQVPDGFRFLIKAPAAIADAALRGEDGRVLGDNADFLDPSLAFDIFVGPCMEGLGGKAGPLVFQVPPMTPRAYGDAVAFAERVAGFFAALPAEVDGRKPIYALELRNPELLTPRLMRALASSGARYCVGLHSRMPDARRQERALAALDGADTQGEWIPGGPLVVRWSLHEGLKYEQARRSYQPFNRLVDEDPGTRAVLARLAVRAIAAGQAVWIVANNKAEGSAPLSILRLWEAISALMERAETGESVSDFPQGDS
jgi:uncharacterized protein YecE (DUF72 family)